MGFLPFWIASPEKERKDEKTQRGQPQPKEFNHG
jgi:hypothetical protein